MSHAEHFDLVVIGAGPAGEKGAAQAAYFGKRVLVVERAPKPGGAAVHSGTIPASTLRETALHLSALRRDGLPGVDWSGRRALGVPDLMLRERDVIQSSWASIEDNLKRHGVQTAQGTARFLDAHTVEIARYGQEQRRVTADAFLLATGASPLRPADVHFDGQIVVDSDGILTLERVPQTLVIIGGGVVGCEYACALAALGVRVTLATAHPRLLMQLDADVSEALRERMTARFGIAVHTDAQVQALEVANDRARVRLSDDTALESECVLWAAGRAGNSGAMGLESLGVKVNARGFVQVDGHYRTAVPHLYAVGDVIGFPALASTAMEQARVAVCHAFGLQYKRTVSPWLPYGVWTIPPVAMVGETEERLLARGIDFEVGRASFRTNPRGQITGDTDGFVKLLFRPDDQRLLGATILGEGACELIHVAMTVLAFEGTLDFFIQSVFAYPTLSDSYKYAAYDGLQRLSQRYARRVSGATAL